MLHRLRVAARRNVSNPTIASLTKITIKVLVGKSLPSSSSYSCRVSRAKVDSSLAAAALANNRDLSDRGKPSSHLQSHQVHQEIASLSVEVLRPKIGHVLLAGSSPHLKVTCSYSLLQPLPRWRCFPTPILVAKLLPASLSM